MIRIYCGNYYFTLSICNEVMVIHSGVFTHYICDEGIQLLLLYYSVVGVILCVVVTLFVCSALTSLLCSYGTVLLCGVTETWCVESFLCYSVMTLLCYSGDILH